jgi:F0F1-type ATP synthase assembly protein I
MEHSKIKKPFNDYARFSGIAVQFFVTILLGVWGGMAIDRYFALKTPVFTAILALLAVVGGVVSVILQVTKNK